MNMRSNKTFYTNLEIKIGKKLDKIFGKGNKQCNFYIL